MEKLELRTPEEIDEKAFLTFVEEMRKADNDITPAAANPEDLSFSEWLEKTRKKAAGIDLAPGYVVGVIYFLQREGDSKILGAINLRLGNTQPVLEQYGHIGYGIAPSERKKGYATQMLAMGLEECKKRNFTKVIIMCSKSNIGSAKTIQNNGGVLENEFVNDEGILKQRYSINIK